MGRKMPVVIQLCKAIAGMALFIPEIACRCFFAVHARKQGIIAWNKRVDQIKALLKGTHKCGRCPRRAQCEHRRPTYVS